MSASKTPLRKSRLTACRQLPEQVTQSTREAWNSTPQRQHHSHSSSRGLYFPTSHNLENRLNRDKASVGPQALALEVGRVPLKG